jgi:hypothetical protein
LVRRIRPSFRPAAHVRGILPAIALAAALLVAWTPGIAQATTGWVDTGGDCLRLRAAPGLTSADIVCLDHGAELTLLGPSEPKDGFTWVQVTAGSATGWVADFYITTNPDDVQVITELPTPGGFVTPPAGGLTIGRAGTSDIPALVASQPFEVSSVWRFDIATQRMSQYSPTAPAFVNSITSLHPDDVLFIRRAGTLSGVGIVPEPSLTVAGTPRQLPTPPVHGMTWGIAGTTDPRFLVQAQDFTVASVWYFHVDSQRWLSYTPGLPDYVQSLKQGHLRTDGVVAIRRAPDAPKPPSSVDSTYFETSITYYYCVPGADPRSHGDGGGYCGTMANGQVVFEGAAACRPGLLGQRFRIEGDPTQRVYVCTDTGGSVLQDHRDIWFMNSDDGYAWWSALGDRAFIEILP